MRRNQVSLSLVPRPPRPSPTIYPHQSTFISHLRKLLPFSFGIDAVSHVQLDEPRDPLDVRLVILLPLPLTSLFPCSSLPYCACLPMTLHTPQPR
jgi:hypothetical protein